MDMEVNESSHSKRKESNESRRGAKIGSQVDICWYWVDRGLQAMCMEERQKGKGGGRAQGEDAM